MTVTTATAILGVPVDHLSMDDAVAGILKMTESYALDQRPRYIATLNVDFIVNILSRRFQHIRHPELLHILRKADMVTADGMPIVWLSRWLGSPLPMRVAGSDLVPQLMEAAANSGKSVYLLGGKRFEMTAFRAARALQRKFPGLKIAGVDSPWVHTAGEALAHAEEDDIRIADKINAACPDILLVAFGSPKQEIWFDRNRHRLKVPVSMGIGATFDFLAGTTLRAPVWMRNHGLEWLFRLIQEPKRLWKRYLIDFFKFGVLIVPSLSRHWINALKKRWPRKDHDRQAPPLLGVKPDAMLSLPGRLTSETSQKSIASVQTASKITFDFSNVREVCADGIGTLARAWQQAEADRKDVTLYGVPSHVKKYLSVNRFSDFFIPSFLLSFSYIRESIPDDIAIVRLIGVLDTRQVANVDYQKFLEDIGPRDCIFDMADLTYIGSAGLMLMLNISKHILSGGNCFVICAPHRDVKQMFLMTDLRRLFVILPDAAQAKSFIHEVRGSAS